MDAKADYKRDHESRVRAHRNYYAMVERKLRKAIQKISPAGSCIPKGISSRLKAWCCDGILVDAGVPGIDNTGSGDDTNPRAISALLTPHDDLRIAAFHSFYAWAIEDGKTVYQAFTDAVYKSRDEAFDDAKIGN